MLWGNHTHQAALYWAWQQASSSWLHSWVPVEVFHTIYCLILLKGANQGNWVLLHAKPMPRPPPPFILQFPGAHICFTGRTYRKPYRTPPSTFYLKYLLSQMLLDWLGFRCWVLCGFFKKAILISLCCKCLNLLSLHPLSGNPVWLRALAEMNYCK